MEYFNKIIKEIQNTGNMISDKETEKFIEQINSANHIFFAGAGRSGLMIQTFANRLLHLGVW